MTRRRADTILALLLTAVFTWAGWKALAWPENARLFPLAVAIPSLALAVLQLTWSARGRTPAIAGAAEAPSGAPTEEEEEIALPERLRRSGVFLLWIAGMLLGIWLVGFAATSAVVALGYSRIVGREGWVPAIGVTVVSWATIFVIFDRLLHVPLPAGELARIFGPG